jgi:hypothetical protein
MVKALPVLLLAGMLWPGPTPRAQTIISESGRLIFFNSLDSARAVNIIRLTGFVNCWLNNFDTRDSFPVLLDFRPPSGDRPSNNLFADTVPAGIGSPQPDSSNPRPETGFLQPPTRNSQLDTASPQLGYDNLFGNSLVYTDSTAVPSDPGQQLYYQKLGLRIRLDPSPDPKVLLQLLEYGIAHYGALRQIRTLCLSDGPAPNPDNATVSLTLVPGDIAHILHRPLSPKLRLALKSCH